MTFQEGLDCIAYHIIHNAGLLPRLIRIPGQDGTSLFLETQSTQINICCTHHSDSIVEESLSKDDNIHLLIDSNVVEDIQRGHRVHSRDDGGEQQVLLQGSKNKRVYSSKTTPMMLEAKQHIVQYV